VLTAHKELGSGAGSLAVARQFVSVTLESWGLTGRHGEVEVVVSELVSNAVRHGGQPVRLTVQLRGNCVRLGVSDHNPAEPVPREAGPDGGFGMAIVEKLCTQWNTEQISGDGKTVWCECETGLAGEEDAPAR
jgi:anti-sigma regulatory factor (Ser/Thr protein kinase)